MQNCTSDITIFLVQCGLVNAKLTRQDMPHDIAYEPVHT